VDTLIAIAKSGRGAPDNFLFYIVMDSGGKT